MNEKEIKKRVEEYKQKLNQDLYKLIEEENVKEAERTKKYDAETDPEEKKNMESQISLERAQSSQKVKKMSA